MFECMGKISMGCNCETIKRIWRKKKKWKTCILLLPEHNQKEEIQKKFCQENLLKEEYKKEKHF